MEVPGRVPVLERRASRRSEAARGARRRPRRTQQSRSPRRAPCACSRAARSRATESPVRRRSCARTGRGSPIRSLRSAMRSTTKKTTSTRRTPVIGPVAIPELGRPHVRRGRNHTADRARPDDRQRDRGQCVEDRARRSGTARGPRRWRARSWRAARSAPEVPRRRTASLRARCARPFRAGSAARRRSMPSWSNAALTPRSVRTYSVEGGKRRDQEHGAERDGDRHAMGSRPVGGNEPDAERPEQKFSRRRLRERARRYLPVL